MSYMTNVETNHYINYIYSEYAQDLMNYCKLYCKNKSDADDCLQEIFIIAFNRAEILKDKDVPLKWLLKTAEYVIMDFNRKHKKKIVKEYYLEDFTELSVGSFEDDLLDRIFSDELAKKRLLYVFRHLTDKQNKLFEDRFIKKLSIENIITNSGGTYSSVTVKISKLKKRIIDIDKKNPDVISTNM